MLPDDAGLPGHDLKGPELLARLPQTIGVAQEEPEASIGCSVHKSCIHRHFIKFRGAASITHSFEACETVAVTKWAQRIYAMINAANRTAREEMIIGRKIVIDQDWSGDGCDGGRAGRFGRRCKG